MRSCNVVQVNGHTLLGVSHGEAVRILRQAGDSVHVIACEGLDPLLLSTAPTSPMSTLTSSHRSAPAPAAAFPIPGPGTGTGTSNGGSRPASAATPSSSSLGGGNSSNANTPTAAATPKPDLVEYVRSSIISLMQTQIVRVESRAVQTW